MRDTLRRDSQAFLGLQSLSNIGGVASADAWRQVAAPQLTAYQFQIRVVNVLRLHGLVVPGVINVLTDAGKECLGEQIPKTAAYVGTAAPPRVPRPFTSLKSRSRSTMVFREGAFDYRNYPSMAAGQRIPYKTNGNT